MLQRATDGMTDMFKKHYLGHMTSFPPVKNPTILLHVRAEFTLGGGGGGMRLFSQHWQIFY